MLLAFWLIGIFPATLLLGWLDWSCNKENPRDCFGSSFGVAVVFWPLTFGVIILTVCLIFFMDFSDIKDLERRKGKDA